MMLVKVLMLFLVGTVSSFEDFEAEFEDEVETSLRGLSEVEDKEETSSGRQLFWGSGRRRSWHRRRRRRAPSPTPPTALPPCTPNSIRHDQCTPENIDDYRYIPAFARRRWMGPKCGHYNNVLLRSAWITTECVSLWNGVADSCEEYNTRCLVPCCEYWDDPPTPPPTPPTPPPTPPTHSHAGAQNAYFPTDYLYQFMLDQQEDEYAEPKYDTGPCFTAAMSQTGPWTQSPHPGWFGYKPVQVCRWRFGRDPLSAKIVRPTNVHIVAVQDGGSYGDEPKPKASTTNVLHHGNVINDYFYNPCHSGWPGASIWCQIYQQMMKCPNYEVVAERNGGWPHNGCPDDVTIHSKSSSDYWERVHALTVVRGAWEDNMGVSGCPDVSPGGCISPECQFDYINTRPVADRRRGVTKTCPMSVPKPDAPSAYNSNYLIYEDLEEQCGPGTTMSPWQPATGGGRRRRGDRRQMLGWAKESHRRRDCTEGHGSSCYDGHIQSYEPADNDKENNEPGGLGEADQCY